MFDTLCNGIFIKKNHIIILHIFSLEYFLLPIEGTLQLFHLYLGCCLWQHRSLFRLCAYTKKEKKVLIQNNRYFKFYKVSAGNRQSIKISVLFQFGMKGFD